MYRRRFAEFAGMLMIGDGLLTVLKPDRHNRLWKGGPDAWQDAVRLYLRHPEAARWAGVAELALGVLLATSQHDDGKIVRR